MPEYKINIEKIIKTHGEICKLGECDFLEIKQSRISSYGRCSLFNENLDMNGMALECHRCDKCKEKHK